MKFIFFTLFVTMMSTATNGQGSNDEKAILDYLIKEPAVKTNNPPLLILLHGVGSSEKDLFSLASQLPGKFLIISARAPNTMAEGRYAWFQVDFSSGKPVINKQQAEQSRQILIDFINQLKNKYAFDSRQVYLMGFSQGGIMAYSVGLTCPDLIKGIAVMSSRLLPEVKPIIAAKANLQQLKIFISHGNNDNTLPVQYARDAHSFLNALDVFPQYKEYAEGHTISKEMLHDVTDWLQNIVEEY
jgi:phospholipase/carboxylesterase